MRTIQDIRVNFEEICKEIAPLQLGKEQGFELALVMLEEYGRYSRGADAAGSRANGNEKPATEKQVKFLQDLGIAVTPNMTSREASRLIEQVRGTARGGSHRPSSSSEENETEEDTDSSPWVREWCPYCDSAYHEKSDCPACVSFSGTLGLVKNEADEHAGERAHRSEQGKGQTNPSFSFKR